MIDFAVETTIPLTETANIIPGRGGKKLHFSTILRWVLNGVRGTDGRTVRLEAIRLGGRWITSREAIQRFAEALTPRPAEEAVQTRTPGRRERAAERAERELEKAGI